MKFNIKSQALKKYYKYILAIMAIAVLMTIVDFQSSRTPVTEIERPVGKDEVSEMELKFETKESSGDVTAEVSSKSLSKKESEAKIKEAEKEIDKTIIGENKDKEHILSDLDLRNTYADGYVEAMFSFEPDIINVDGSINYDELKEDTVVAVSCTLDINDISKVYEFPIKVLVPSANNEEGFMHYLSSALSESDKKNSKTLKLPETVGEKKISFFLPFDKRGPELLLIAFLTIPLILILEKEKKKKEKKEYQNALSVNYAVIVEKLALFVNAGIRPKEAFKRIIEGNKKLKRKGEKNNAGYREIEEILRSMENGQSEAGAYVTLGERTNNKEFRRLSLLLSENIKKGDRFLADELMKEERDAFEKRKHRALSLGEEASTKMIIPMIILLMIIMILLILPAWMSMGL